MKRRWLVRRTGAWLALGAVILWIAWSVRSNIEARRDPVVQGRRMSEWALALVREPYGSGGYGIKEPYRSIFRDNRETAIPWLMAAVNYRHSKMRIAWFRFTQKLPPRLSVWLRPQVAYTNNRWAGALALSNLARQQPDARIGAFFLECMHHESPAVRKVAAYEAGPWLDPEHPEIAVQILACALADSSAEVRRDACRRLVESAGRPGDAYSMAARALLPILRGMDAAQTPLVTNVIPVLSW